jgi:hypothetical protein
VRLLKCGWIRGGSCVSYNRFFTLQASTPYLHRQSVNHVSMPGDVIRCTIFHHRHARWLHSSMQPNLTYRTSTWWPKILAGEVWRGTEITRIDLHRAWTWLICQLQAKNPERILYYWSIVWFPWLEKSRIEVFLVAWAAELLVMQIICQEAWSRGALSECYSWNLEDCFLKRWRKVVPIRCGWLLR